MTARFNVDQAHASKVKILENEVKQANNTVVKRALKNSAPTPTAQTKTATATGSPNRPNRTSCQPEFTDNDKPLDVSRVVDLASVSEQDFRSTHQFLVLNS